MLPILGLLAPLLGKVAGSVCDIIDKKVEDKDLANQLKAEATQMLMRQDHKEFQVYIESASSIIRAEAQSGSWLACNWRPMLMTLFGLIIANNYVIYPYINLFWPGSAVISYSSQRLPVLTSR